MGATRRALLATAGAGAVGSVGAATLAACGAPQAGESPASSKGPQEVTWSIYGDQTTRPFFDAITNRFNEQKSGKFTATLNLVASA